MAYMYVVKSDAKKSKFVLSNKPPYIPIVTRYFNGKLENIYAIP